MSIINVIVYVISQVTGGGHTALSPLLHLFGG
jgi:hypothetical protein